jgi:hypothetical protein
VGKADRAATQPALKREVNLVNGTNFVTGGLTIDASALGGSGESGGLAEGGLAELNDLITSTEGGQLVTAGSIRVLADAEGGSGRSGDGGAATAGVAELLLGRELGNMEVPSAVTVRASARGGFSSGGEGGSATGGQAAALFGGGNSLFGSPTYRLGAISVHADAISGFGRASGAAEGGQARLGVLGGTLAVGGSALVSADAISSASGSGGVSGDAQGGTGLLEVELGAAAAFENIVMRADARGGDGADAGAGRGGSLTLSAAGSLVDSTEGERLRSACLPAVREGSVSSCPVPMQSAAAVAARAEPYRSPCPARPRRSATFPRTSVALAVPLRAAVHRQGWEERVRPARSG